MSLAASAPALAQTDTTRPRQPAAPAAVARVRGWMPLAATGVPRFLSAHPTWDGRGVLIAILDSGVDPGVPGLDSTSSGRPKVLDVRDFSGEGRIPLKTLAPRGDSVELGGRRLAGFSRVRGLAATGPWYGGLLAERPLGEPPASDVNANGSDADTLALVVGKTSDGWVLFADSDGDGSLADERPVRDYLTARETFGWHRPGEPPPVTVAANFSDSAAVPLLSLVYDTEAHGTHVAGIAAGRSIGGVAGFDGVAPGAQLLGLKISRNDFGGLTTTGSVVAALDYAIRFAAARRMPLVVNMSFGVGNEREGAARLDGMLDSLLLLHPEVSFFTSAGNDGPGLSTIGFPGSMRRAITVGATQPSAFLAPGVRAPRGDPVLFFSSRGGELAKPDLVAPGTAYSTVPNWNMGDEFKSGTSMASPHAAGLGAILLSAALAERRSVTAEDLRRALVGSGRPVVGAGVLDVGAGTPELEAAWQILQSATPGAVFDVENLARPGTSAAWAVGTFDTLVRFRVRRVAGTAPLEVSLSSDAPWLVAPATLSLSGAETSVTLVQHPPATTPGSWTGTVRATAKGSAAPLFELVSSVVIPEANRVRPARVTERLAAGGERRVIFAADSGRPFRVRTASARASEHLVSALHQPGGQPILGDNGIPGSADNAAAVYDVDGRDVRRGYYQAVAIAPPDGGVNATIAIDHSPVGLALQPGGGDAFAIAVRSLADSASTGRLAFGLLGGERSVEVKSAGGSDVVVPFRLPAWVRHLVVDLELDPAQWPRFTDFGLTAVDAAGRILGKGPANYARARTTIDLPVSTADQNAKIVLAPGFAEPKSMEVWTGRVTIRLQADGPVALEAREGDEFRLAPGQSSTFHSRVGLVPWSLPEGFAPLGLFLIESGGITWTWELPVPGGR